MASERILVADDSPTIVDVVKAILEEEQYEVITASDGQEALDKAHREAPDLVLLDVEMPRLNGYAVCKLLKEDPATSHIPVIMLTSKSRESDRMWGFGMGADEYLTKPVEPERLVEAVKEKLG